MYYVYVLRSIPSGSLYKGHCSDLKRRLAEHNAGKTKSIKHLIPWEIAYFEQADSIEEAVAREKYFKSSAGRRYLKKLL
jgi:putative endonuclease